MKEAVSEKKALSVAQKNMLAYWQNSDMQYVAEDAKFKNMATGEEYRGRAEIGGFLHYMFQVAFQAKREIKNYAITDDKAMYDGFFKGRHIGEFNGVQPTKKEVNVPVCVTYDLKDGLIREARIFLLNDVLLQQLGAATAAKGQKTTFVTRDIFYLKFGHYKEVKALLDDAMKKELMPEAKTQKVLTDFTGDSYRLILEQGFDSLDEFEKTLSSELRRAEWQRWYEQFKQHVESGHREILKQVF